MLASFLKSEKKARGGKKAAPAVKVSVPKAKKAPAKSRSAAKPTAKPAPASGNGGGRRVNPATVYPAVDLRAFPDPYFTKLMAAAKRGKFPGSGIKTEDGRDIWQIPGPKTGEWPKFATTDDGERIVHRGAPTGWETRDGQPIGFPPVSVSGDPVPRLPKGWARMSDEAFCRATTGRSLKDERARLAEDARSLRGKLEFEEGRRTKELGTALAILCQPHGSVSLQELGVKPIDDPARREARKKWAKALLAEYPDVRAHFEDVLDHVQTGRVKQLPGEDTAAFRARKEEVLSEAKSFLGRTAHQHWTFMRSRRDKRGKVVKGEYGERGRVSLAKKWANMARAAPDETGGEEPEAENASGASFRRALKREDARGKRERDGERSRNRKPRRDASQVDLEEAIEAAPEAPEADGQSLGDDELDELMEASAALDGSESGLLKGQKAGKAEEAAETKGASGVAADELAFLDACLDEASSGKGEADAGAGDKEA